MKKVLVKLILSLCSLIAVVVGAVWLLYSGGNQFQDRTEIPLFTVDQVEVVTDLPKPPGNIAVSPDNRIFFTFHPEARPDINVAELVDGKVVAYPSVESQPGGSEQYAFQEVLSIRVDQQNRLWALDNAFHGTGKPRILSYDLSTNQLIHSYDFPDEVMPFGSHANDFQVSADGRYIYIADASIIAKKPAIVVYDSVNKVSRRVLENDISVRSEFFTPVVQGREMEIFGIFSIRPGVDSIALDKKGEWLYFAAVTSNYMYRISTDLLINPNTSSKVLKDSVQQYALKSMSDGITMDKDDSIYITDPEHSAILKLDSNGNLSTLLKDKMFRWPDGFSFGPDDWLYFTGSALHQVIGKTPGYIESHSPYQIFRFKPGSSGIAGH